MQQQERKAYQYYDLVMALFVTVLLLSNLLSSAKIIDMGAALGPIAFIFDAGTLVFPISYIFGDVLTEVYGYKRSRRVIWTGFGATVLMGFFVWLTAILPGESEWQGYAGQEAYDAILGGISGLIVASLVAYFAGEFSNSYVLARMKVWQGVKICGCVPLAVHWSVRLWTQPSSSSSPQRWVYSRPN